MEYLWPPDIIPSSQVWGIVDNTGSFQSPTSRTVRTVSRAGSRLRCTITIPPVKGEERARIKAAFGGLRMSDTMWVTDFTTDRRGSISTPELFTNNDFSNGTTGWTGTYCTLTAPDGVLRLTNTKGGAAANFNVAQVGATVTQYAPYALRSMISALSRSGMSNGTYFESVGNYATNRSGLVTQSTVVLGTTIGSANPGVFDSNGNASVAGDYAEISYCSLARCALVDNGPNALLQSQTFATTWSVLRTTVTSNSVAAPDGTTTADTLNEDGTAANTHAISQGVTVSSAVAEYSFSCYVKAGTRSWVGLYVNESAGGHNLYAFFNLSTGAVGTVASSNVAGWTNPRAHVVNHGDGWWRCTITGRKASAATTITPTLYIGEADADATFDGLSAASLYLWGASLAQSSVPVRYTATTTTATTGTAQTGSGIYLKGLPTSTSGLLKAGDPVQIGSQKNFAIAPLDSDASGLGYLQCALPWLSSAADNAPVIFNTPMSKMRLAKEIDWDTGPGQFSGFQLEFVEDVS